MLSRLLRIVNVSVALLLILLAIAIYWYAIRPLPQTSGELNAPISGPATVKRDARGVPHVEASSWQDAMFLQGFVTAQDRLWQMDVLRRFGAGELAEVFGPAALPADEESRRMRMRAIAEAQAAILHPSDRAVFIAYARGVNFFIDTHRGRYPLEFSLPGHAYDPRDWSVTDSLLVGLVMFRNLSNSWKFDFDKGTLVAETGNPVRVRTLFPAAQGEYVSPGSNAWAVSGAHSADGKPIVANDPHLEFGIPPTWYLVHLKAPGLDVTGASLPGVPCVITGHNNQVAWGITNMQADVMDIYAEELDPRTGRYIFKGSVQQAQRDRQTIGIKGQKPVALETWVTHHGPVLTEAGGRAYSMRWTAAEGFGFPFFDVDRATNWTDFRAAIRDFWGPGQNFVYADRAGNIGYQATGKIPIRRNFDSDVPLDGASGEFEWDGFIPFEQLPSIYNPASGILATANQNPFPPGYPYRVEGNFHDRYRIDQIRARLNAKPKLSVQDMLAIQKDVYSTYDSFLAKEIVAAFLTRGSQDALVHQSVDVLRRWNGQMDKDLAAPMITELLSTQLGRSLVAILLQPVSLRSVENKLGFDPQNSPNRTGGRPDSRTVQTRLLATQGPQIPDILPRPEVIQDLLQARPAGWVTGNDWDRWLLANLVTALNEGRKRQGTPVSRWKWGRLLEWKFAHPVGKELPLVDGYFDIGPVEMSGSGTTVKQTTATLGPSERMVADLANWDKSVQNVTTGESGNVASKHYKDQWPAYYAGKSFPMEFDHIDAKETLHIRAAP